MNNSYIKLPLLAAVVAMSLPVFVSCGGSGKASGGEKTDVKETYEVNGVKLDLAIVEGGTFTMGACLDNRTLPGAISRHQVILDGYAISKLPISQALWTAVMGNNPASVQSPNLPVDRVTFSDCRKFIKKLSKITGVPFGLPTEAQWEYACDEGKIETIKNCKEWCSDFYTDEAEPSVQRNPEGPEKGSKNIIREPDGREPFDPHSKSGALTFRVAVWTGVKCAENIVDAIMNKPVEYKSVAKNETIRVGNVSFDMVAVKGGKFKMGATSEQGQYADEDELPVRDVEVGDFSIGRTEVTAALWKEVMGILPAGNNDKYLQRPVINVSWYDCQEFIIKLNALTGKTFRLPSEAEWEFAARGGVKSHNYRYAGSHEIGAVAVYGANSSDQRVKDVKTKMCNELGLYDMSGNAWEWCQDTYALYGKNPSENEDRMVMRGGSAAGRWNSCRLTNRSGIPAINIKATFGLRLAL
jgi:hypothetical protein